MRESYRAWTESMETFLLDVIFEQRRGYMAALVRSTLYKLSKVYQLAIKTRRFFLKRFN